MKACVVCQFLFAYTLAFSPIPLLDIVRRKRERFGLSLIVIIVTKILSFEEDILKWQDF